MDTTSIRINKFLAFHTGISRREADNLVQQGRVAVGNTVATSGMRVTVDDLISIDGKPLRHKPTSTTIVFHKPIDYICSRRRQGDTPTIYELLPNKYRQLKPVGRLDKDSSGIILLTDNGDFAHQMTHPSFYKTKVYEVTLDKPLQPLHQQMISDFGVLLEDGKSRFILEKADDHRNNWKITMSEGRNRQIRRTFAALGYSVIRLHRIEFGEYSLGDIEPGKMHAVNMREVI